MAAKKVKGKNKAPKQDKKQSVKDANLEFIKQQAKEAKIKEDAGQCMFC